MIVDSMRGFPNAQDIQANTGDCEVLSPNLKDAENNTHRLGLTSTGFYADQYGPNRTFIYMAIRRPDPLAGKPVEGFSIEQNGDLKTIMNASRAAKEMVHHATELQREECDISELWISTKCGESDTTTGLGANPTVGSMYDKLLPVGITGCFGETSEITGTEHICRRRAVKVPHNLVKV